MSAATYFVVPVKSVLMLFRPLALVAKWQI